MAGSEAGIPPSAGSVLRRGSRSSSPCSLSPSGGSRHPVGALKKWLTNPVRKANPDAAGEVGKVEGEARRLEKSHPPPPLPLLSHGEMQPRPPESPHYNAILPSGETVRAKRGPTDGEQHNLLPLLSLCAFPIPFIILSFISVENAILQVIITLQK